MQLPVYLLAQVMLTTLKAWEREERTLLWAQPLQKVHVMSEQKPHGAVSQGTRLSSLNLQL